MVRPEGGDFRRNLNRTSFAYPPSGPRDIITTHHHPEPTILDEVLTIDLPTTIQKRTRKARRMLYVTDERCATGNKPRSLGSNTMYRENWAGAIVREVDDGRVEH